MNISDKINTLQHKINMLEDTLIPKRKLASELREQLRRHEEAFAYTQRREPYPTTQITPCGTSIVLDMDVSNLLSILEDDIEQVLKEVEPEKKMLKDIENLLKGE